jgi:hypothetical protein
MDASSLCGLFLEIIVGRRHTQAVWAAYPLCDQEPKTIQHLLFRCMVAREVWAWALTHLPGYLQQTRSCFSGGPLGHVRRRVGGTCGPPSS